MPQGLFLCIKKGLKALSHLKSLFLSLFTCDFYGDFSPVLVWRKSGTIQIAKDAYVDIQT